MAKTTQFFSFIFKLLKPSVWFWFWGRSLAFIWPFQYGYFSMAGLGSAHTRDLWNSSLMQVEGVHSAAITEDPAKLLLEWGMLKHLW